jgi:hypothetical protein
MTRGYVEDVVGPNVEHRTVVHLDVEKPLQRHPRVMGLAALICSTILLHTG